MLTDEINGKRETCAAHCYVVETVEFVNRNIRMTDKF